MADGKVDEKAKTVPVFLRTDTGQQKFELPASPIQVSDLKALLGVPEAETLFEKDGGKRIPLADGQTVNIKPGMHFEALGGGGVS